MKIQGDSDTPRTEAEYYTVECAANYGLGDEYADHVVDVEFARKLERELSAKDALLAQMAKALERLLDQSWNGPIDADHPARDKADAALTEYRRQHP